jgi:1,4-alpha-glucan branching enzyme
MRRRSFEHAVSGIVNGDHHDPFSFLGMHLDGRKRILTVRAFLPGAHKVTVIDSARGTPVAELSRVHEAGLFASALDERRKHFDYRLRVADRHGEREIEDPYRFPPILGDLDLHLLAEGNHLRSFEKLGAHPTSLCRVRGVSFAVWAPDASRVSVIGEFNEWDGRRHPMRVRHDCGVWEIFLPGVEIGALYKYELRTSKGEVLVKADPYAFEAELRPRTASVIHWPSPDVRGDDGWMEQRGRVNDRSSPIAIYEVHLGSWRRKSEEGNRFLTYRELADELVPYAVEMGFTHLELLPVCEHPFDGSWGYQPTGLFAATSRFGTPSDFRFFVERCHREGLAVLVDWVPGHFPNDPHGLGCFDGTCLYEHADPRQGLHSEWKTLIYNFGRSEVANFLISNALFWLERYNVDGLRVDAVASMLYLDYSRAENEWIPNVFGGNENLEAIDFLKRMNEQVYANHPGIATIAEESTAWPMVSRPTHLGGLGFGYKWNMGWMNDSLSYISRDPVHRRHHHEELTFSMIYAFDENFILPLSHDEVVHGKGSLLGRMPGDRWQKFANLRAYLTYMYTHPGKKLLFMGGELGQDREWSHDESLDWHVLADPMHAAVQALVRDLNRLYRSTPALHELDCEPGGFAWIDCHDHENSVLSYIRRARDPRDFAVVICNFTPVVREGYRIGVPRGGYYAELLNSDAHCYGGGNVGNLGGVTARPEPMHGMPFSLSLTLPPLATLILRPREG